MALKERESLAKHERPRLTRLDSDRLSSRSRREHVPPLSPLSQVPHTRQECACQAEYMSMSSPTRTQSSPSSLVVKDTATAAPKRLSLPPSFSFSTSMQQPASTLRVPMTPPEQALRARLERVLWEDATASASESEKEKERRKRREREKSRQRSPIADGRRTVSPATSLRSLSNSFRTHRSPSRPPPQPPQPTVLPSDLATRVDNIHMHTHARPSSPLSQTQQTYSYSGRSPSQHASSSGSRSRRRTTSDEHSTLEAATVMPMTPPPTPPLSPSSLPDTPALKIRTEGIVEKEYTAVDLEQDLGLGLGLEIAPASTLSARSISCLPHLNPHSRSHSQPAFNALRASERLRNTSGYVSFASVEGLGQPPETPVMENAGESRDEQRGRRGWGVKRLGRGACRAGRETSNGNGWIGWVLGQG